MSLDILKREYNSCKECPELADYRTQVVFGSLHMKHPCPLMIIGEAPGRVEDEKGEPFVGKSGQLLTRFLEEINLTRDDVFITNTILCRPPENRNPKSPELKNCRGRLDKTIEIVNPSVIITLGNFSTQYILETKQGITGLRGKAYVKNNRKVVPMPHPATLLYNGMAEHLVSAYQKDFAMIKDIMDGKFSDFVILDETVDKKARSSFVDKKDDKTLSLSDF